MPWRRALAVCIALGTSLGTIHCKVINEDHCANQEVPGGAYCRELYGEGAPYCSPCRRELHGCVDYEPFSCAGYYDEIDDGAIGGSSSSGSAAASSAGDGMGSTSGEGTTTGGGSDSGSSGTGSSSGGDSAGTSSGGASGSSGAG